MATFPEYERHDALGLAELVRRREVSAAELVEAAIERIERRNPVLNAVVYPMFEEARATARRGGQTGPFAGVPFLLKDLGASYPGVPLSSGSRYFRGYRPRQASEMVRRWLAAGVIVVGKTNTPELGLLPVTEPEVFGPTRNPWDLTRTPGGSSGGSGAAVAARMVPAASGGDGGGSIRIPASCCGVFGFKPSRGRTPSGPDVADAWHGFVVEHVLTVSVRDSAAMLDATHGPDLGAFHCIPPPTRRFVQEVDTAPGRLRIGWSGDPYLSSAPIAPECRTALYETAGLLRELGHEVVEARPPLDAPAWCRAFLSMLAAEVAAELQWAERETGRRPTAGELEDTTWMLAAIGRAIGADAYASALRELKLTGRHVATYMAEHRLDALLSPTLAKPPIPIGGLLPRGVERVAQRVLSRLALGRLALGLGALDRSAASVLGFVPFTPVFNASGQPSMSVPLHWSASGLPIGSLLTGRHGDDATLFQLAGQLERARPWRDRVPPAAGA